MRVSSATWEYHTFKKFTMCDFLSDTWRYLPPSSNYTGNFGLKNSVVILTQISNVLWMKRFSALLERIHDEKIWVENWRAKFGLSFHFYSSVYSFQYLHESEWIILLKKEFWSNQQKHHIRNWIEGRINSPAESLHPGGFTQVTPHKQRYMSQFLLV